MLINILTLFPAMFSGPFDDSIIKRARLSGHLTINLVNIRDFSTNKHHTVDDTPYGGGAGMVMGPEPIFRAVEQVRRQASSPGRLIYMSPAGRVLTQPLVRQLAQEEHLIILCGHYEGIDERVREVLVDEEISIGDYVLTGGELPAMVLVDAVARFVPGVLGKQDSAQEESFSDGLLEYPHYTRPRSFRGLEVPEVLLSGHHENIRLWRRRQSLLRTLAARPELLKEASLTAEDKKILRRVLEEIQQVLDGT
ncbi:MAG: tRNA (guanosine(37)-N1)-methyltransferase TrmD [Desulfurispora sp.]|uniref:tRNA (guanosine(37)-N1)-methyltransferase TrmD n=1 Tax=Desulfurispora sp. TaxID=3014275 RepID=UPI00404B33F3